MKRPLTFTDWFNTFRAERPRFNLGERERALMEKAWEEAHQEGYSVGYDAGHDVGFDESDRQHNP